MICLKAQPVFVGAGSLIEIGLINLGPRLCARLQQIVLSLGFSKTSQEVRFGNKVWIIFSAGCGNK